MTRKLKIQFYRDRKKEWRWRIVQPNGKFTATGGGDGYKRITEAVAGFNSNYRPEPIVRYLTHARAVIVYPWAIDHYTVEVIR